MSRASRLKRNIKEIIINNIKNKKAGREGESKGATSRERSLTTSGADPLVPRGNSSKGYKI
jgi:hypothetical protein